MSVTSAADFAAMMADPAQDIGVLIGEPCVVVRVTNEGDLVHTRGLAPGPQLACVVVALAATDELAARCSFADVVVDDTTLDSVASIVRANPVAATTFALLLRDSADRSVSAGLIAESGSYSTLLASPEFTAWRAPRTRRPGDRAGKRVRVEREGDVLSVVLTRPERRNAYDHAMRDALVDSLAVAVADPSVSVRLSGEGAAFCSGGDLDEFGSATDPATAHLVRLHRSPGWLLHRLADRTTAYLHGACIGSGIELPAFAGTVLAAPNTVVRLPEISMGLIPGSGGTVSLPQRIGRQRTAWLGLTGSRIDAETALAWGLVDRISW